MDFFLDGTKGLGLIGQQTVAGTKGVLSISEQGSNSGGDAAIQQFLEIVKNNSPSAERAGRFMTLSQIHSALSIANEALDEIGTLRDRQVQIAEEAVTLATGERTEELQVENDAIETRIGEIASSATYNGRNVLGANTYGAEVYSTGTNESISVPDVFNINAVSSRNSSSSWALDFSSQPELPGEYLEGVYAKRSAFGVLQTGYSDALEKSSAVLNSTFVEFTKSSQAVPTLADAQKLVRSIADQIGSQFSSEEATAQLIEFSFGKADAKKISDLLTSS